MLKKIEDFLLKNNIYNKKIIVGLSGGPDSIFLINSLNYFKDEFNLNLISAHLDHEWRLNSNLDVDFCKKISENLNILFIDEKASKIKLNKKNSGSKEDLGRNLRRRFFENSLIKYQADYIALGHNFDDQIETFLIRLIRGASISGLSSIKKINNRYIRPILDIKKSEILDYLNINNLDYLQDETNSQDAYLRNRIRKYIVPNIRFCDKRFDLNFKKSLENIKETDLFLESLSKYLLDKISLEKNNALYLDIEKFKELDKNYNYLYPRIILLWLCYYKVEFNLSGSFFKEIVRFIKNSNSKEHNINKSWSICKEKNYLKINYNSNQFENLSNIKAEL